MLAAAPSREGPGTLPGFPEGSTARLSPELAAALRERPVEPGRALLRLLRADGRLLRWALALAVLFSAGALVLEGLLLRGLLGLGVDLAVVRQRLAGAGMFALLAGSLLLVDFLVALGARAIGRHLETRLRIAFLEKIPRLQDRYFNSRPTSDMAERSHILYEVRQIAALCADLLRLVSQLLFVTAALAWLDPESAGLLVGLVFISIGVPLLLLPTISERDLRVRSHLGGIARFYLDALQGLTAIKAHAGERAVRREHESLLVEWARARLGLQRTIVLVEAIQSIGGFGLAAGLIIAYLSRIPQGSGALLFAFWALYLPVLGQEVVLLLRQYPVLRNIVLRLLEPLGALEDPQGSSAAPKEGDAPPGGVAIDMQSVTVRAGGHLILRDVTLSIPAGQHVCIVGPSGAGKSSLVGLLLGWHRAAEGSVTVDGAPPSGAWLDRLRARTAWLDPAVQIWNRSFFENLRYGNPDAQGIGAVVDEAELADLLEALPEGLQTLLGEGGGLVSGGEGQRVRFGRALLRPGARLVILDEPFRGLDRARRQRLLRRAQQLWQGATLLCITHDIAEAQAFERVLVLEAGKLLEEGAPADLLKREGSRYQALLRAEEKVRERLWSGPSWKRLRVEQGRTLGETDS